MTLLHAESHGVLRVGARESAHTRRSSVSDSMDGSIQGRGTASGRKVRVSFVTAKGVPPVGSSSVPTVLHEITRRCVDRLDTRIIGGSLARDARKEAYGIEYNEISDRVLL